MDQNHYWVILGSFSDQKMYISNLRIEIIISFVFSDRNIYIYILDRNHHQGCSLLYFKGCLYHGVIDLYHRYEYVDLSGTTDFVVSFSIEETRCWLVVYIDWYKYVNVYEYVIFYIICHGVNRIHCFSESFTGRAFHIREQVILPQYMFTRSCNPFFF